MTVEAHKKTSVKVGYGYDGKKTGRQVHLYYASDYLCGLTLMDLCHCVKLRNEMRILMNKTHGLQKMRNKRVEP